MEHHDDDISHSMSQNDSVSPFIKKTFEMVSDDATNDTCQWDENGTSFIVRNEQLFSSTILPTYFRHKNFSSFVRQLNFYGFHKRSINQKHNYVKFNHPYFQRDRPDLLTQIKRKPTEQTTNFKLSLDILEQKYDTLQKSYDDLQFTLKNMLFIFARYMSQHQQSQTINPADLQQKLQDLQGRVTLHNQMPAIDSSLLHKRPRLMLDAGKQERDRRDARGDSEKYALTQQHNDDAELYQQILHLTERMSKMPNGSQHVPHRPNYASQYNDDEYADELGDGFGSGPNNNTGNDGGMYGDGNAPAQQHHDRQRQNQQQSQYRLPVPSNIELIEDDELSPKPAKGASQFKAKAGAGKAARKSATAKRVSKSPTPKLEDNTDNSSVGTTATPLSSELSDVPPLPGIDDIESTSLGGDLTPNHFQFGGDSPHYDSGLATAMPSHGTAPAQSYGFSPAATQPTSASIFDTNAPMSPLHPMLTDSYLDQPNAATRQDSNIFDNDQFDYAMPGSSPQLNHNVSPLGTPVQNKSQTAGLRK